LVITFFLRSNSSFVINPLFIPISVLGQSTAEPDHIMVFFKKCRFESSFVFILICVRFKPT